MPYIGNPIYQSAFVTDTFSGNGTTTDFTMSVAPAGVSNVLIAISGVLQDPATYGVVGNTLNFSQAPPTGTNNISCRYLGVPATGVTTTAYRTQTEFTATAGQTTFSVPSYTPGFIDVYRNGVLLSSTNFVATNGTTVVLNNAASAGDLIETISFLVSSVLNAIPATAGAVGTANIADNAITTAKIAAGAVIQADLATGVAGTGPAFSATRLADQTISTNTFTKLQFNTETFDTNSNYDPTTNYRFTPTVEGYYQINGNISFAGSTLNFSQIAIYKNGSLYANGAGMPNNTSVGAMMQVASVIYLNGSTDYIELYCWQNTGGNLGLQFSTGRNTFSGCLVRAA